MGVGKRYGRKGVMGIADSVPYAMIREEGKQSGELEESERSAEFCYVIHERE